MKMDAATISKYPKFHYYVRVNTPEVSNVTAIVSAIKKFAGTTSRATIKKPLKWGENPKIEVVKNLGSDGLYTWGSDILQIDEDIVEDFEAGKGLVQNSAGKRVYLVGVTLLHELTHWADAMDAVDNPVPGDPTNEEGWAYEKRVYGTVKTLDGHVR